jgi:RNA polymerase sigma-70 factor (ECF subfamily)
MSPPPGARRETADPSRALPECQGQNPWRRGSGASTARLPAALSKRSGARPAVDRTLVSREGPYGRPAMRLSQIAASLVCVLERAMALSPFERARGLLFGIAYRMLSSGAEAEDLVQEAYVRWHQADQDAIENPEAWLVTTVTRLTIDRLGVLKTERAAYTGPWLPEPLTCAQPPSPDRDLELASDLSVAFLVLLERLATEERAAFLLQDVFEIDYPSIARLVGKTETACRQIVSRARARVRRDRKRFQTTEAARIRLLRKFVEAVETKNETALLQLFAPDATWMADGGGKAPAAERPLEGAARIVSFLMWLSQAFEREKVTMHMGTVNGETGLLLRTNGVLRSVWTFATDGEQVLAVFAVVNPDKLQGGLPA